MDDTLNQNDGVVDENITLTPDENIAVNAPEEKGKAYTEIVQLFDKLSRWNPTTLFDDATVLLVAAQQLLLNYNEQSIEFINDSDDNASLLIYISSDGLDQWHLHKEFKNNYGVAIY